MLIRTSIVVETRIAGRDCTAVKDKIEFKVFAMAAEDEFYVVIVLPSKTKKRSPTWT